jgi:hypothetical protein
MLVGKLYIGKNNMLFLLRAREKTWNNPLTLTAVSFSAKYM